MLLLSGWYSFIGEKPLKIASSREVEADAHFRSDDPADYVRPHGRVHMQKYLKAAAGELPPDISIAGQTFGFIESDKLNSIRAFQKLVFGCTDYPANAGVRERRLQRADDRKCMATVAYCGQAQYANCIRC